ncbi:MAG: sensor histidine kinase [Betaproteobacteria bacterium]|nr:MAG: sensor histidine kinase [Betaproteobacteria bacterium]
MSSTEDRFNALDQQAWQARFTSRETLRTLVEQMQVLAASGSQAEATALYHHAVWAWQANERTLSHDSRNKAALLFERLGDVAGLANCRDLEALAERLAGNFSRAATLYAINRELPESARTLAAQCVTYNGEGAVYLALTQHDECQRVWSIAVSLAQKAGNPGLEVSTLCNLGAWNITVCNFEDGRRLCQKAFALAERVFDITQPSGVTNGWLNSGMNLLVALDSLGEHAQARGLAERLLAREAHFPPGPMANYFVTFASVMLHAGDRERAEVFLRKSMAAGSVAADFAIEQSVVQAEIWNAIGRYADTRDLCARLLADEQTMQHYTSAQSLMRFYNAATRASEALGDYETALRHQKIAFERYEELVGKSARARRLTLEIQTELQRTEWQRDQALKLRAAAELEQGRLAELNAALEAANAAKSSFLAAASHDLRQPVHAVSLLIDTLAGRVSEPLARELVSRIQHSTSALQRLLRELLDISELDAGATTAHISAFPISDLLLHIDHEFRDIAQSRQLQLRLSATDAWVASDPQHLLRMVRNVVTNALTYTEQGGVLIAARVRGDTLLLEVWDTGVGIDAAHLPHLFDAFYQVGNRARDRRKGLGLGLAVAQRLARLLNHSITVQSRPGRGTVVRLTLPVAVSTSRGASVA